LLLDLDGLKKINDCYGHLAGSRALCRVGEVLRLFVGLSTQPRATAATSLQSCCPKQPPQPQACRVSHSQSAYNG